MQYAVILAAGMGSRMKSHTIKVLHPILGKTMVQWSVDAAHQANLHPVVVVGHQADAVKSSLEEQHRDGLVSFALQPEAKGTGHAVLCALPELPQDVARGDVNVLVFFGDTPLFTSETLEKLMTFHRDGDFEVTFLTATLPDAGSYGRLVRDENGRALKIVEAANATPEELAIQEFNTGAAVFDLAWLHRNLPHFQTHPPKDEVYLTDALEIAAGSNSAGAMVLEDASEANGVNTRVDLAVATKVLQDRIVRKHMLNGVGFADPNSVTIEPEVQIDSDVWIERGVVLRGDTSISTDSVVDAYSVLESTQVGTGVHIAPFTHCHQAVIQHKAKVGPYARLREGTSVGQAAKVGNFVEMKKTQLGPGAKASHLSYLGDAKIGARANIGAGTITCNYNGYIKSKTTIGEDAFIGSNSALVAPVIIEDRSIVGAGSVITKDVPEDDIAIARGSQQNLPKAAIKYRAKYQ